jgi:hypothetical protein
MQDPFLRERETIEREIILRVPQLQLVPRSAFTKESERKDPDSGCLLPLLFLLGRRRQRVLQLQLVPRSAFIKESERKDSNPGRLLPLLLLLLLSCQFSLVRLS